MPETQAQTPADTAAMTPAQSHAEIQQLLRAEIDALRDLLEERFREIAMLTSRLEEIGTGQASAQELAELERRHRLEIILLHRLYASWKSGPAEGVPNFQQKSEMLRQSNLFEPSWYLNTSPDVSESGMTPKEHDLRSGAFEGRNPGPGFDTMAYYMANSDVAEAGWPALVHYAAFGRTEGRPLA